jgi:serine/threonine protein phosphatase PrpC
VYHAGACALWAATGSSAHTPLGRRLCCLTRAWERVGSQAPLCAHFAYVGMFDGHGGRVAAQMCGKQLLADCLLPALDAAAMEDGGVALGEAVAAGGHALDTWWALHAPAALFAAFVAMDKLVRAADPSGATASVAVVCGRVVTVAGVGDSYMVLDTGSQILRLSPDHRVDNSEAERQRCTALGGKIAQSAHDDGTPMGPLRVWPGGLAISRTIGDRAAAAGGVIAEPEVSQVVVPLAVGVRLIAASDGLWDGLTIKAAARAVRGKPAGSSAAAHLVREAVKKRGKADDVTIVVLDVDLTGRGTLASHNKHAHAGHHVPTVKLIPKYPLVMHHVGAPYRFPAPRLCGTCVEEEIRSLSSLTFSGHVLQTRSCRQWRNASKW